MTSRGFVPVLREVEGGLAAPVPSRVRILRELEADLEDLRRRFQNDGLSADEARQRAIDALVPDSISLAALDRLHAPWYRRATARIRPAELRKFERGALALATMGLLVSEVLTLANVQMLEHPSRFLWPILAMGAVLFGWVLTQVFKVWIKREARDPTRGIHAIAALSGFILVCTLAAVALDFFILAQAVERNPDLMTPLAIRWLVSEAILLSVGLGIFLMGSTSWLVLNQWWTSVSNAHHDLLDLSS